MILPESWQPAASQEAAVHSRAKEKSALLQQAAIGNSPGKDKPQTSGKTAPTKRYRQEQASTNLLKTAAGD